ncbi:MAG: UvrD-helicase domain-containing protein [Ilumatobacteraceae bacterium]
MPKPKQPATPSGRRARAAIDDADQAAITTLHGFANRILGDFAVAAGLPPRIRVLDEVSSQLAHEERWRQFVDRLHEDPAHAELLYLGLLLDIRVEERYSGQVTMKDVAAELDQNWDRLEGIEERPSPRLADLDLGPLRDAAAEVRALLDECSDPSDKLATFITDRALPEVEAMLISTPRDVLAKLLELQNQGGSDPGLWKPGNVGSAKAWAVDVKAARATVRSLNAAALACLAPMIDAVIGRLLWLVAGEVARAADARRRDGALEFHDLLVLARSLLRRSPDVRRQLHERYRHLLLDEFQDTDPIQIELAALIASGDDRVEPGPWHSLAVPDGRLFFVGDPKQSIYRFRRADVALFLDACRTYAGSNPVRLTTNFRTVSPVLDWVNDLFTSMMVEEPGKQPSYEPLVAERRPAPGRDHRPVLLGGAHEGKVSAGELRELEAASVAEAIDAILADPDAWPVRDPDAERAAGGGRGVQRWRRPTLGDITILVPTRTSLTFLRTALESHHIPYRLATGTLVYDTQEIRDLVSTLKAIDDPSDTISLVAALRSPLFACSDVDLFTWTHAGGVWDLRSDAPDALPPDHPVASAIGALRQLWRDRWWLTPAQLLDRVMSERRAMVLAFGDPRHREVWRRLRFFSDQARTFEESGGVGLRAFLAWVELQGEDRARVHEPLLPETDDDAVQIMTVHGSKGLEFPITILSGLTTAPNSGQRGLSILWEEDRPPSVRLRRNLQTGNHDLRADLEAEMDGYEKDRLLYVALTRPRTTSSCRPTTS